MEITATNNPIKILREKSFKNTWITFSILINNVFNWFDQCIDNQSNYQKKREESKQKKDKKFSHYFAKK